MKTNVLVAFRNIVDNPAAMVVPAKVAKNRLNNSGDALEGFVKQAFTGLLGQPSLSPYKRDKLYNQCFSWLGNQNNPPDGILRGGDAIEVKKIGGAGSNLELNSSPPKQKLLSTDTRVTEAARNAEDWLEKDVIYVVGVASKGALSRLWFIYGDCYAANKSVYERISQLVTSGVTIMPDIEFGETNELARINKVDPLGITNLRVRGMWSMASPSKLYGHLTNKTPNRQYYLMMRETKYQSFDPGDRANLEDLGLAGFNNQVVDIKDPDNPADIIKARLIRYEF